MDDSLNLDGGIHLIGEKNHQLCWRRLVDISRFGLNSKIKKFNYSFICRKGYSPSFVGRIAFCLQSATSYAGGS